MNEPIVYGEFIEKYGTVPSIKELKTHPWMLVGYGIMHRKRWTALTSAKSIWKKAILESGVPTFGVIHPKVNEYCHPCPRLVQQRETYLIKVLQEYQNMVGAK